MEGAGIVGRVHAVNEECWRIIGSLHASMGMSAESLQAHEAAIRNNPHSTPSLKACAHIHRKDETREGYMRAIECLQRALNVDPNDGDAWGSLGYCYLMVDDAQKAFTAYQQALYLIPSPQDPYLWYGLGILYERYNSYDQADEYFTSALRQSQNFEKKDDIQYRLGVIHKQQKKYDTSLQAFNMVLDSQAAIEHSHRAAWTGQPHHVLAQACAARQLQPEGDPHALVERLVRVECEQDPRYYASKAEIWFQVGHVRELTQDYHAAKEAYEHVLDENPAHAKALQQLGWLHHNIQSFSTPSTAQSAYGGVASAPQNGAAEIDPSVVTANQEIAVKYLQRSIEANPADDQAWYLLGRCYMTQREYTKAHKAYERAVNINDSDPTYWCSIGVLYYYNQQFHDALDTYSRALQLNPELSEIWYNLGILYECCHQITDAVDAYTTAAALDASNQKIKSRLTMLKRMQRQQPQPGQSQSAAQAAASAAGANSDPDALDDDDGDDGDRDDDDDDDDDDDGDGDDDDDDATAGSAAAASADADAQQPAAAAAAAAAAAPLNAANASAVGSAQQQEQEGGGEQEMEEDNEDEDAEEEDEDEEEKENEDEDDDDDDYDGDDGDDEDDESSAAASESA